MDEIFTKRFYRSNGGRVTVSFPYLDSDEWTIKRADREGTTAIVLILGKPGKVRGTISVSVTPTLEKACPVKDLALLMAKAYLASNPHLKPVGLQEFRLPGGSAANIEVAGNAGGVSEVGHLMAILEGNDVVGVSIVGNVNDMNGAMKPVAKEVIMSIRVGKNVAALPQVAPGVPIEGVFVSDSRTDYDGSIVYDWYVFDARGFVHDSAPTNMLDLDFIARFQSSLRMGVYSVEGDKMNIKWREGKDYNYKFKQVKDDIELNGDSFYKVSGRFLEETRLGSAYHHFRYSSTNPMNIAGWSSVSSSTTNKLDFSKDGTFSEAGYSTISGTTVDANNDPTSCMSGFSGRDKNVGRYKINGHWLELYYADGMVARCTAYKNKACFISYAPRIFLRCKRA